jgi:hypothetical protein
VADRDKHISLLRCSIDYSCKKFYGSARRTITGAEKEKKFRKLMIKNFSRQKLKSWRRFYWIFGAKTFSKTTFR